MCRLSGISNYGKKITFFRKSNLYNAKKTVSNYCMVNYPIVIVVTMAEEDYES